MITKAVIDTNVVLKWIPGKDEEDVSLARKVYAYIKKNDVEMWAPEYMLLESLQVFVRKRLMKPDEAIEGVELLRNCGLIFEQIGVESFTEIAAISKKFNQSVYDALFLYLAKKKNCTLITFDEKVWKRCALAMNPKRFLKMAGA